MPLLWAETPHARAVFTTRRGGLSSGPLSSLNLSWRMEEELDGIRPDEKLVGNRDLVSDALGTSGTWRRVRQVHGAAAVEASRSRRHEADALWTSHPDRPIAILVADCVPIFLGAPGRIAAVHAGWRGLVAGVVGNAVEAMGGAQEALAGPAIGPCCFEVGPEVVEAFTQRFGPAPVTDERHVDLWTAAELAARQAGVASFHAARLCTSCHPELFFSHRRDAGRTGRQALVAALR
ncbi:MAG TPA: polyphenol oxidase family protein [Actinomycetota bacterium]|nr:polyphenol oxidase family protein [Actinomycetota bacterium]